MMKNLSKSLFLFLLFTLLCFACTSSQTPVQPESGAPLTDGLTPIRAEAGPVTVTPPQGYLLENGKDGISLSGAGDEATMLIGLRMVDSSGQSADQLIETYMLGLPSGWNRLIDGEEIAGINGRGSRYSLADDSGLLLTGRVIALTMAERDYLFFAVMDQEDWIVRGSTDFSTMLSSLEIDDTAVAQVNLPAVDEPQPDEVESQPTSTPKPTATPPAQSIPPFTGQSADGYACFAGFETGLNCILPSGEFAQYTADNSNLRNDSIFAITSCPDGRILMADVRWLVIFDGVEFTYLEQPEEASLPDLIGCGAQGEMWLAYFTGVSLFRDDQWEFFDKSDIVLDSDTVFQGLEIGPDGTAWIMTFNEVSSLTPGRSEWEIYAEGQGLAEEYFFDALSLDNAGNPYLSHSNGYIWRNDDQWLVHEVDGFGFFGDLEVTIDQHIYQTSFNDGLTIYTPVSVSNQSMTNRLSRNNIDLIDSDSEGRVWVNTETGIDIFDGDSWTQLRVDNSELAHNRFRDLVIIGAGPNLPQTAQERPGEVKGTLHDSTDQPLANTAVVMCLNGYISFSEPEESPCIDSVEAYPLETDSVGVFHIENVPSGWYELFFMVDGIWQLLQAPDRVIAERIFVEADQTTDIGLRQAEPND